MPGSVAPFGAGSGVKYEYKVDILAPKSTQEKQPANKNTTLFYTFNVHRHVLSNTHICTPPNAPVQMCWA